MLFQLNKCHVFDGKMYVYLLFIYFLLQMPICENIVKLLQSSIRDENGAS
jgi:hypothetical protein